MNDITVWDLILLFFVFIPAATLWFRAVFDIFDRRDLGGAKKVAWLLGVLAVPLLGALFYVLTRPVTEQDLQRLEAAESARGQVHSTTGHSIATEIEKLDALRSRGLITDEEFTRQRDAVLA